MTTAVTMMAAAWSAFEGKKLASVVFGMMHLAAFTLDACSHIPGGKVRTPAAVLGIVISQPPPKRTCQRGSVARRPQPATPQLVRGGCCTATR